VKHDVEEVNAVLERHGFHVVAKYDLDHVALAQAFSDFIRQYGQDSKNRLFFYVAGHGYITRSAYGEELGYLVPADAPDPRRQLPEFQRKAMELRKIEMYATQIQSRHALFVIDAPFSGSLFALSRAIPGNISSNIAEPVRQFITSASADETVPDDSIFRAQFVLGLQNGEADMNGDGFVTGTELGEFLQDTVVNYSRGAQHP
jgi:hypothetical protein